MHQKFLTISTLFISLCSLAQNKTRIITDNDRKFIYTDSAGVTSSYISYFGNSFPVPALITSDGRSITPADCKGKTIVFNFWFVACKPCVAEIPALNKLVQKYQSDSILFIALTFDNNNRIKQFLEKREFAFQIASLPQSEIDKIKHIAFYPFTAIVNREGILSFAIFGRPSGKNPEEEIFNLLNTQVQKVLQ